MESRYAFIATLEHEAKADYVRILEKNEMLFKENSVNSSKIKEISERNNHLEEALMKTQAQNNELNLVLNKSQNRNLSLDEKIAGLEDHIDKLKQSIEGMKKKALITVQEKEELQQFKEIYVNTQSTDLQSLIKLQKELSTEEQAKTFFNMLLARRGHVDQLNREIQGLIEEKRKVEKRMAIMEDSLENKPENRKSFGFSSALYSSRTGRNPILPGVSSLGAKKIKTEGKALGGVLNDLKIGFKN